MGNLTSRILTLSEKYLEKCPEISEELTHKEFFDYLDKFDIQKGAEYVWNKIGELDKRIQETEPFKVIKVDPEKGKGLIKENVLKLYEISEMLVPLLPETSKKIQDLIKQNKKPETPLFLRK